MRRLLIYFLIGITFCFAMQKQSDEMALIRSCNQFAFTINKTFPKQENTIYSPFCLYSSMMMAYLGSERKTGKELKAFLKLSIPKKTLPRLYNQWSKNALISHFNCKFFMANGIWIEKTTPILSEYSKTLLKCFHTKPQPANFQYAPEKMRATINNWIGKHTEFYVDHLLTKEDVTEDTKIILASGSSFQGSWETGFNEAFTTPSPFYIKQKTVYVEMMHQTNRLPFYETQAFKAVALPFSCSYYFVVVLPKDPLIELNLNAKVYQKILTNLQEKTVDLKLPKFSIDRAYNLNDLLIQFHVTNPFSRLANFSEINGRLDLYLSNISHGSFLSIDEYGALSSSSDAKNISMKQLPFEVSLHADHPFFFFLCDLKNFSLFFMGKCVEPNKAKQ